MSSRLDTLTHNDAALDFLSRTVGNDCLLYGGDYSFEMLDPAGPCGVRSIQALTRSDEASILADTACRMLRLKVTAGF